MPRRGGGAGGLWGLSGGGELRAGVNENTIPNTVIRPDTPSPLTRRDGEAGIRSYLEGE